MGKRHNDIINSIMFYGRLNKEQAEDWAVKEFGSDWRSRKATKSKRIILKESNDKEDDDE